VEIKGSGWQGFEGDVFFTFERSDGKKIRILSRVTDQTSPNTVGGQIAKITVKEPCQPGDTVYGIGSGIPSKCDYVRMSPGIYNVYTEGNVKSNEVTFKLR
jgi:hypothetical protein